LWDRFHSATRQDVEIYLSLGLTSGRALANANLREEGERLIAAYVAPESNRVGVINELIRLFDGPEQREAKRLAQEALGRGFPAYVKRRTWNPSEASSLTSGRAPKGFSSAAGARRPHVAEGRRGVLIFGTTGIYHRCKLCTKGLLVRKCAWRLL
jgi:hypothetical protein